MARVTNPYLACTERPVKTKVTGVSISRARLALPCERHPADGRARCVTLTAKGRQVFNKLWTRSEPLRARLLAAFRPDEVTTLVGLLRRVAEVLPPPVGHGSRTTRPSGTRS